MAYKINQIVPMAKEYYYRKGLISFSPKRFTNHFYRLQEQINSSGLSLEQYFHAATLETVEERLRGQILFPRLLASDYTARKVEDYYKCDMDRSKDGENSYKLTALFWQYTNETVDDGYFEDHRTIPQYLIDIKNWETSLLYCVMDDKFMVAIKNLDIDIYEEYLGNFDLKSFRNTIYLDTALYNTLRSIKND